MTKGAIDYSRYAEQIGGDPDVMVAGHVHYKGLTVNRVSYLTSRMNIEQKNMYYVRCATYKDEFVDGAKGWHVEKGRGARPLGGWWLNMYYRDGFKYTITETEAP